MLRRLFVLSFLAGFVITCFAQQKESRLEDTEPALIPSQAPPASQNCRKKHREEVEFDVLVNSSGVPAQYYFRSVRGSEADLIALRIVAADHFAPARRAGLAIQVERIVAVNMELCVEKHKESDGTKSELLNLAAVPDQRILRSSDLTEGELQLHSSIPDVGRTYKIGGNVWPPKPLFTPEARFTDKARKTRTQGICLIRLIVDQHGAPQNEQVVKPLGMGLDEEALKAIRRYRFRPAMKDGQFAVPVLITVEVNFRLG